MKLVSSIERSPELDFSLEMYRSRRYVFHSVGVSSNRLRCKGEDPVRPNCKVGTSHRLLVQNDRITVFTASEIRPEQRRRISEITKTMPRGVRRMYFSCSAELESKLLHKSSKNENDRACTSLLGNMSPDDLSRANNT